jgi:hypothetical protein
MGKNFTHCTGKKVTPALTAAGAPASRSGGFCRMVATLYIKASYTVDKIFFREKVFFKNGTLYAIYVRMCCPSLFLR